MSHGLAHGGAWARNGIAAEVDDRGHEMLFEVESRDRRVQRSDAPSLIKMAGLFPPRRESALGQMAACTKPDCYSKEQCGCYTKSHEDGEKIGNRN
jgi:hypothetical protein